MIRFSKYSIILLIITLSLIVTSCKDDLVGPDEYIEIEVFKGTTPDISWDVGPIHRVIIYRNNLVVWAIYTPAKDSITSPVKYGQLPQNALLLTDTLIVGPIDTLAFGEPLILNEKYYIQAMKYSKNSIGGKDFIVEEE